MSEFQRLQVKRRGIKASVTKLITKVEDMISADLEGINTQSVSIRVKKAYTSKEYSTLLSWL